MHTYTQIHTHTRGPWLSAPPCGILHRPPSQRETRQTSHCIAAPAAVSALRRRAQAGRIVLFPDSTAPRPLSRPLCACVQLSSRHHDKRLASKHLAAYHVRRQQLVCIVAKPKLAILAIAAGPCIALLRHDGREAISTGHHQYQTCLAPYAPALDSVLRWALRFTS